MKIFNRDPDKTESCSGALRVGEGPLVLGPSHWSENNAVASWQETTANSTPKMPHNVWRNEDCEDETEGEDAGRPGR